MTKPRVLLLSSYDTPSHRYWCKLLQSELDDYEWTYLTLPARHFAWRVRGNSLTWGLGNYSELNTTYSLIIATSMVDISALKGFRPNLAATPTIVYFHENQFAYPLSQKQQQDVHLELLAIYNAACATQVVFNSNYNKSTFMAGAEKLLKKLPDGIPESLLESINHKTAVLPVPINREVITPRKLEAHKPLKILWNHRWEYDKNPEDFFQALIELQQRNIPFEVNIVGQTFRKIPPIFDEAKTKLIAHIKRWGFQSRENYELCLRESDIVVSSAYHDFQGLALQEAMAEGCIPLCPERVAYPEYVPTQCLYSNTGKDSSLLVQKLVDIYENGLQESNDTLKPYLWSALKSKYNELIQKTIL
ncbi:tRNA-queuosine alpha-mannosyltransferase domain-containing protein [Pleionea sediminis]|uniref:tRNA-queuosine alpha-mannosyltransferase domain-containing protein n=1 Tax=Pleionea sediminis TaxID=2569479 RepID=UPI0011858D80|nr:DUF3524 domain-containing protein [Pleionea sediminis]